MQTETRSEGADAANASLVEAMQIWNTSIALAPYRKYAVYHLVKLD